MFSPLSFFSYSPFTVSPPLLIFLFALLPPPFILSFSSFLPSPSCDLLQLLHCYYLNSFIVSHPSLVFSFSPFPSCLLLHLLHGYYLFSSFIVFFFSQFPVTFQFLSRLGQKRNSLNKKQKRAGKKEKERKRK